MRIFDYIPRQERGPDLRHFQEPFLFPTSEERELPCFFACLDRTSRGVVSNRKDAQARHYRGRLICYCTDRNRDIDDARKLPFSYIPAALHASDVGADARLTVSFVWRNDGRSVVSITPSVSSGTK